MLLQGRHSTVYLMQAKTMEELFTDSSNSISNAFYVKTFIPFLPGPVISWHRMQKHPKKQDLLKVMIYKVPTNFQLAGDVK